MVDAEAVPPLQLQGLQSQLEFLEQSMVDKSLVSRQEAKIRELETRLEFERTQVKRLEVGPGTGMQRDHDAKLPRGSLSASPISPPHNHPHRCPSLPAACPGPAGNAPGKRR